MATTVKQQEYLAKQERVVDRQGKYHYIYPMIIGDLPRVTELFSVINMEYAVLNMPRQAMDGNTPLFDEDNDPIMDTTAFDAQAEILSMCFNDTYENIEKWCDMSMIIEVLDVYQGVSGLKKQIAMEGTVILPSEQSLQALLKTPV